LRSRSTAWRRRWSPTRRPALTTPDSALLKLKELLAG
jgi:hypothetical protein